MSDDVCDLNYSNLNITFYVYSTLGERCQSVKIVTPTIIIYSTIFLLGLFGNTCTCIVIAANKSMHNPTNYYLFSLAVSDILALILGLPMELYQSIDFAYPYRFGEGVCKARAFLIEFTSYASIMIICCFSFERWMAICYPLRVKIFSTLWRANFLIVLAWIISCVAALPIAFIVKINKLPLPDFAINQRWTHQVSSDGFTVDRTDFCAMDHEQPEEQKAIIYVAFCAFFVIPAIVILLMYGHIAIRLRSSETNMNQTFKGDKNIMKKRNKSNRTVLKMLVSVVLTFFLCWLPFHIQRLLSVYLMNSASAGNTPSPTIQNLSMVVFYISGFCYYSNSAANPILYNILSEKYRRAFCRTILGKSLTKMMFSTYSISHPKVAKKSTISFQGVQSTKSSYEKLSPRLSVRYASPQRAIHESFRSSKRSTFSEF